jgi:hypothetical protein
MLPSCGLGLPAVPEVEALVLRRRCGRVVYYRVRGTAVQNSVEDAGTLDGGASHAREQHLGSPS